MDPARFELVEKRYLLDQALDHELDAFIKVLKHNLHVIGYPIDGGLFEESVDRVEHGNLFEMPLHGYEQLRTSLICYVDALGSPYLMPCLCQNPSQTKQVRQSHRHVEVNVLQDTSIEKPASKSLLVSSQLSETPKSRKLNEPIDFENANITEEELMARLASFEAVREAHKLATASLR